MSYAPVPIFERVTTKNTLKGKDQIRQLPRARAIRQFG